MLEVGSLRWWLFFYRRIGWCSWMVINTQNNLKYLLWKWRTYSGPLHFNSDSVVLRFWYVLYILYSDKQQWCTFHWALWVGCYNWSGFGCDSWLEVSRGLHPLHCGHWKIYQEPVWSWKKEAGMAWILFCIFSPELQGCMQRSWKNVENLHTTAVEKSLWPYVTSPQRVVWYGNPPAICPTFKPARFSVAAHAGCNYNDHNSAEVPKRVDSTKRAGCRYPTYQGGCLCTLKNLHGSHESPVFWLVSLFLFVFSFAVTQSYFGPSKNLSIRSLGNFDCLAYWGLGDTQNICRMTSRFTICIHLCLEDPHFTIYYYRKYIFKCWICHGHVSLWGGKSLRSTKAYESFQCYAQVWIYLLGCC